VEKTFALIEKEAGGHFDPELARLLLEAKDAVLRIRKEWTPGG